jgi:hypothetical protein
MSKTLLTSVTVINLCLVTILLLYIRSIDSDKGVTLLYFYYPVLVGVNLLLGIVFKFVNPANARAFFISAGILLLALFPAVIIVANFE